jgi:hypothetical protein
LRRRRKGGRGGEEEEGRRRRWRTQRKIGDEETPRHRDTEAVMAWLPDIRTALQDLPTDLDPCSWTV